MTTPPASLPAAFGKLAQACGQEPPLEVCESRSGFSLGKHHDEGPYLLCVISFSDRIAVASA